ncbi:MAG: FAD binding domain-containing protein [Rhodoblastus sp.]
MVFVEQDRRGAFVKASSFQFHRASSRSETLEMLAALEGAKIIAGGQSLVAMLNMRYAFVDHLIDINGVEGLAGVDVGPNEIRIGAMTRQRDILASPALRTRAPVVAEALRFVGHLHTRNRGTLGGSLGHMDPAAELMAVVTLLDATVHVESARGARDVAIADYPQAYMTPALEPDELIVGATLRPPATGHGWSFREFAQRHGDFAVVAVGATIALDGAGKVSDARIVLSGVGFAPRRLAEAERMLASEAPGEALFAAVAAQATREEALSDAMASEAYRKHLAGVLTRRAVAEALARAKHGFVQ